MRRQGQGNPIESVHLKIKFTADASTALKLKESFPESRVTGSECEISIEGSDPGEVAERAHKVLEKLRAVIETPKGFK
ncbi:MAG: hypothetical protein HY247_08070 [archaeon]|nr:MAG: hypothetical protein HY247_08070 [archaeon]